MTYIPFSKEMIAVMNAVYKIAGAEGATEITAEHMKQALKEVSDG